MKMFETILPQWEYVDDCYKGVIAVKSDEKRHLYLPKFPVEERNPGKDPQYKLRCWAADYDNIFKSAIMSMVGVMGKIPAKVEFGNVDPAVRDLDVWGNEDDDRLIGLKARLNHAQPNIAVELVRHSVRQLRPIQRIMRAEAPPLLPGHRLLPVATCIETVGALSERFMR
jgi:hypothetical protein